MKKLLFLLLAVFMTYTANAEPFAKDSVIQAQQLSKDQIYDALKRSFVTNFKDSRDVLQIDDPQNGRLMAKLHFPFKVGNFTWQALSGYISCVAEINIREGRFKVRLTDFIHEAASNPHGENARRQWCEGLIMSELPDEYKKGMLNKQHREAYKRLLPAVNDWSDVWFSILGSDVNNYKPVEEEDW